MAGVVGRTPEGDIKIHHGHGEERPGRCVEEEEKTTRFF